ncbi:MAG: UV DNA damage repair endonuclease UvsE [Planctomycetota bacterium]|jgi:UV DNA damage endonuclease
MDKEMVGRTPVRFGFCCMFREQPIKFRNATVKHTGGLERHAALEKLSKLCEANASALEAALRFCAANGIGCFRVNSQILPLKTHDGCGYNMRELPEGDAVVQKFQACGDFCKANNIRTCFHPDQFVVLNSKNPEVLSRSLKEIEYQAEVAEWIGADVVNIHAGGVFGDKAASLARFAESLSGLSARARGLITVENDDSCYTPTDLLPVCESQKIPLVYDVHHHRCNPDSLSIEEATRLAAATWDREPMFHLSSPAEGWEGPKPRRHHDYIDPNDFPDCWKEMRLTVEVEAKAKELAVLRLMEAF